MTLLCRLRGADRHIVRRRLLLSVERAGLTTREIDSAVGAERVTRPGDATAAQQSIVVRAHSAASLAAGLASSE
jgi:hypothetical protein